MESFVTDHAKKRIKERVSKTDYEKLFEKVLKDGYDRKCFVGSFKRYLDKLCIDRKSNVKLYNRKIYVYSNNVLITVLEIPKHYINSYLSKTKIKGE